VCFEFSAVDAILSPELYQKVVSHHDVIQYQVDTNMLILSRCNTHKHAAHGALTVRKFSRTVLYIVGM